MDKRSLLLGLGCLAFSFVIGCTGKIIGGGGSGGSGSGAGGDTTTTGGGDCADATEGGYCAVVGDKCNVDWDCGGAEYTCEPDHVWSAIYYDDFCCASPVNDCPLDLPKPGDPCDACSDVQICNYDPPPGCSGTYTMQCDPSVWAWTLAESPACADDCTAHTDPVDCNAQPACHYFATGCPDSQLATDGCYSTVGAGCGPDVPCPAGKTCTAAGDMQCGVDTCSCFMTTLCL